MAMDCIECAVMPTAAWLTPVAVQNRITRSCAVSGVVVFAIATPSANSSRPPPSRPRAAPELGPAILERPKAKKIGQTAALQCFLLVAFCGDFDEKLRGCSCNGLCQGRGGASR